MLTVRLQQCAEMRRVSAESERRKAHLPAVAVASSVCADCKTLAARRCHGSERLAAREEPSKQTINLNQRLEAGLAMLCTQCASRCGVMCLGNIKRLLYRQMPSQLLLLSALSNLLFKTRRSFGYETLEDTTNTPADAHCMPHTFAQNEIVQLLLLSLLHVH